MQRYAIHTHLVEHVELGLDSAVHRLELVLQHNGTGGSRHMFRTPGQVGARASPRQYSSRCSQHVHAPMHGPCQVRSGWGLGQRQETQARVMDKGCGRVRTLSSASGLRIRITAPSTFVSRPASPT